MHSTIRRDEVQYVCETIRRFFEGRRDAAAQP
jgi:hypothetical protein